MVNYIIILSLIAVILVQVFVQSRERKDLYNRLMANDYTDYANNEPKVKEKRMYSPSFLIRKQDDLENDGTFGD